MDYDRTAARILARAEPYLRYADGLGRTKSVVVGVGLGRIVAWCYHSSTLYSRFTKTIGASLSEAPMGQCDPTLGRRRHRARRPRPAVVADHERERAGGAD